MEVAEGYKDTKIGRIPKDWEVVRLGEVCLKIRDGNYGGSYPKANEFLNSGVPFLTSASIGGGNFIIKNKIKFISPEKHSELTKAHIKFGDVLFTNRGANVGSVALVSQELDDANIGPQLTYLRCKLDIIDNQYLFSLMQSNSFQKQVKSLDNGTAMNFFGIGTTKTFKLPVPSLPEQQKIAEILSTVDKQISTTQAIIDKSKELKKGLMQKLFSEGIGHTEFKDTKIGRIPKDWEVIFFNKLLADTKDSLTYGILQPAENVEDGIPMLRTVDFKEVGRASTQILKVSEEISNSSKSTILNGDEIIMSVMGTLGRTYKVPKEWKGWNVNRALAVIRTNEIINKDYLCHLIRSSFFKNQITRRSIGSAQIRINLSDLRKYNLPLPPLFEQQKIADILSEADTKIEKEEQEKAKLEELKKGLMQQLLTGKKRVKV